MLRGVYLLDPELAADPAPRIRWRAALLAHGRDVCLVAGTGARALGVHGLASDESVIELGHVAGMPRARRREHTQPSQTWDMPDVVVRQIVVHPHDVVVVEGLPVSHPRHTVVDAALGLDRMAALAVMDSGLHLELLTPEELAAAVLAAKGRPGIQQLRPLAALADGRAESPLESRIRLICIDGRLPPDDLQYPVYDDGGVLVARGDLGWFRHRRRPLLAEADGRVHALPTPVFRDRRRGNLLVPRQCDTVRFTWADSHRPPYVLYVVRNALSVA